MNLLSITYLLNIFQHSHNFRIKLMTILSCFRSPLVQLLSSFNRSLSGSVKGMVRVNKVFHRLFGIMIRIRQHLSSPSHQSKAGLEFSSLQRTQSFGSWFNICCSVRHMGYNIGNIQELFDFPQPLYLEEKQCSQKDS